MYYGWGVGESPGHPAGRILGRPAESIDIPSFDRAIDPAGIDDASRGAVDGDTSSGALERAALNHFRHRKRYGVIIESSSLQRKEDRPSFGELVDSYAYAFAAN